MKILLIDVNCKYSSTGKIVYDLYRRLNEDGHEARVAYGRGDVIDEPGIYKFGLEPRERDFVNNKIKSFLNRTHQ